MNYSQQYSRLLELSERRHESIQNLIFYLETQTNWLTAPASKSNHLNCEGGLWHHSINVATTLITIRDALNITYTYEACMLVGLFHDVGKIGLSREKDMFLKRENGIYASNHSLPFLDVPTRSIYLLAKFVDLEEDEIQAIRYHDGSNLPFNYGVAGKECGLTLALQFADHWCATVVERDNDE